MCGVIRTSNSVPNSELVESLQDSAIMPPSITLGTDPPKPVPSQDDDSCQILSQQGPPSSSKGIPTIDLSTDDAELQKAIALSLQDHQPETAEFAGISAEERDVSKVIEDSIFDNSSRTTVDLLNPLDRRRISGASVGLKNIGNSCWFNVVIQPLFFIPSFRDMILNYPKSLEDDISCDNSKNKMVVATLRHLFTLLIATDKKYIDPTEAVDLFQGSELRKNMQQDVCEFIHKLLEKLEEEFKLLLKKQGIEKESLETNLKESDFIKLFYGQSKKEIEEEDGGPKLETFGQYPLTVKKYKDIHESILASMANGTSGENGELIRQDTWFKTLPSVLIFSLSRYEFSKEKQRAEKVHNKFDFPEYLFMDRYMEYNKEIVKEKHKKIAKIKQELNLLYNSLEKYQRFGSGEAKYPLADILQYVLEFAESKNSPGEEINAGIQSPSMMEVDNQGHENDIEMTESEENKMNSETKVYDSNALMSPNKKMRVLPPAPKIIEPNELSVLQSCIPRWKNEVEIQVNNLKKSIDELEQVLLGIFEEPELQCIPYKLHAVVVHEGQASGGHYWVYIYDSYKNVWMKFNDIQVSTSGWEELMQESVGGQNNASAYCLMYIDEAKYKLLFSDPKQMQDLILELPLDLQEYAKQDNTAFHWELQEWENKKDKSTVANDADTREVPATAPNSPDILCIDEEETKLLIEVNTMLSQVLVKIVQEEKEFLKQKNKVCYLCTIINNELMRLKDIACSKIGNDPFAEPALLDLGIYLVKNKEQPPVLNWYAFEILWHITQDRNSEAVLQIHKEATSFLRQLKEKYGPALPSLYQQWKKHYLSYLDCTWHFLYGFRKLQNGNDEVALILMMQALTIHKHIIETPPNGCAKTLDIKVLSLCHRKSLQIVNEKLVNSFLSVECENEALDIIQKVMKIVAPALWIALSSDLKEDQLVGESIRQRWFQIHEDVPPEKALVITQLLQFLTNDGCEFQIPSVRCPNIPSVLSLYKEYRDIINIIRTSFDKNDTQTSDL